MLAVVKPGGRAGRGDSRSKDPAFGRTDVLVKVKVASICGTDLHIYNWDRWAQNRIHPPLIPGHEFCGEVAAFGDEVTSVKEGDFVSAEMHVACGKCLQCRTGEAHICQNVKIIGVDADGAFAEYVVIPESNIWKLDPAIPQEYASILDPLGNAVHTVLAGEIAAKSVAITGCGPIGLFSIAVAQAVGATSVFAIEVNEHRRKIAREMKADYVLNPAKEDVSAIVMEKTGGLGVDVVLEMAGHPDSIRTAFDIVRRGGRISLLGLTSKPISLNFSEDIIFKGITVQGINGRRMYQTWYQMTALLKSWQTQPASGDHRPHPDEGFLQGHGAPENGRSQQDSGVSQRREMTVWRGHSCPRMFQPGCDLAPEQQTKVNYESRRIRPLHLHSGRQSQAASLSRKIYVGRGGSPRCRAILPKKSGRRTTTGCRNRASTRAISSRRPWATLRGPSICGSFCAACREIPGPSSPFC